MNSSASTSGSCSSARPGRQGADAAGDGGYYTAQQVKDKARELGFDLVGITSADSPNHSTQFQQWLADGFQGEMAYMQRNAGKRVDPQQVLAGAHSIIVVGMNYYPGQSRFIARYAVASCDYHD